MTITRAGVVVNTWGTQNFSTEDANDKGLLRATQSYLSGNNVGHTSLLLSLPDTPANRDLVHKHLGDTSIPVSFKHYETKKVIFEQGKAVVTDENMYSEDLIEVYFSRWPGFKENEKHHFNTFAEDGNLERAGLPVHYESNWGQYLCPAIEENDAKMGNWSNPVFTLGPGIVTHERNYSPLELNVLRLHHEGFVIHDKIKSTFKLMDKLKRREEKNETTFSILPEEMLILKNLFPDVNWEAKSSEQFMGLIELKLSDLIAEGQHTSHDYLKALDDLDQRNTLAIVEAEYKTRKKTIHTLKTLFRKMKRTDITTASVKEIEGLNDLLRKNPELDEEFPQGITAQNFQDIKNAVYEELTPDIEGSQASKHKDFLAKREQLNQFYHYLDTIAQIKQVLKMHTDLKNNKHLEQLLRKEDVESLAALKASICPKTGTYFEKFNSVLKTPDFNVVKFLEDRIATRLCQQAHSLGAQPSHSTTLPLKRDKREGLEVEPMLSKMAEIAHSNKAFKLAWNNCASSSIDILAAGAGTNKPIFQNKALTSIVSPQMVYNQSVLYSSLADTQTQAMREDKTLSFMRPKPAKQKQPWVSFSNQPKPIGKPRLW